METRDRRHRWHFHPANNAGSALTTHYRRSKPTKKRKHDYQTEEVVYRHKSYWLFEPPLYLAGTTSGTVDL